MTMNHPEPAAGSTAEPRKKRGGCLKWALIIVGGLIGLMVLAALMGGSGSSDDKPSSGSTGSAPSSQSKDQTDEEKIPTEYKSALRQAENYSSSMRMSKQGVYDQLTSEYGGQFSDEAAQYAIDHVEADWKENALKSARSYQDTMHMSPEAIRDQLTSEYGGGFTEDEAQYAIDHLED